MTDQISPLHVPVMQEILGINGVMEQIFSHGRQGNCHERLPEKSLSTLWPVRRIFNYRRPIRACRMEEHTVNMCVCGELRGGGAVWAGRRIIGGLLSSGKISGAIFHLFIRIKSQEKISGGFTLFDIAANWMNAQKCC